MTDLNPEIASAVKNLNVLAGQHKIDEQITGKKAELDRLKAITKEQAAANQNGADELARLNEKIVLARQQCETLISEAKTEANRIVATAADECRKRLAACDKQCVDRLAALARIFDNVERMAAEVAKVKA